MTSVNQLNYISQRPRVSGLKTFGMFIVVCVIFCFTQFGLAAAAPWALLPPSFDSFVDIAQIAINIAVPAAYFWLIFRWIMPKRITVGQKVGAILFLWTAAAFFSLWISMLPVVNTFGS